MAKQYTAQEMRELAEMIDHGGAFALTDPSIVESNVAMLRQAADAMEREKDYEYAAIAKKHDGEVFLDTEHFGTLESAKKNAEEGFYDVIRYERREVGEWEAVKR